MFSCSTTDDVDVSKYPIITTVHELAENFDLDIDNTGKFETTTITRYFGGSSSIDYTYDLSESTSHDPIYYSIVIDLEPTEKEAILQYNTSTLAIKGSLTAFGGKLNENPSIKWGDESYYGVITTNEIPTGHILVLRNGKNVYTFMISGVYTSDDSIITELILPSISDLESFKLIN